MEPKKPTSLLIKRKRDLESIDWGKQEELSQKHGFGKSFAPPAAAAKKPPKAESLDGRRLRRQQERKFQLNFSLSAETRELIDKIAEKRQISKAAWLRAALKKYQTAPLPGGDYPAAKPWRLCILLSQGEKQQLFAIARRDNITFSHIIALMAAAEKV